ncbi:MAG TPA: hypothetical protein VLF18_16810 [Tahibacter sp.]|uniref:hypothetical protein n=1 Tax=Tahibacter sp. TaxID=2056211 RepID=UPI002B9CEB2E|nr:hypothetical protein [Tahibacter sp.]HSX61853.1 hypothetical protein [Tahibacter sp.]
MTGLRLLLAAGLALAVSGFVYRHALPPPEALSSELREEPQQTPTRVAPFSVHAKGVDYRIEPKFDYDIAGLLVSSHDSATWWDTIHAESNDHLNVADLCLVWGANAADGAYRYMRFHNAQFTCYYAYPGGVPVTRAHERALSNNHLLTTDARVARAIRALRIGDQVRLRGQLASYSHNTGFAFARGTSTTREDGGNGACETIFVDDLQVLARAPAWPRALWWAGLLLLGIGSVVWYRRPFGDNAW